MPVGAYGGRIDLMDQVLPAGKVFQAGTLSGNPLATAAGIATLQLLRDAPPYAYLESLGDRLGRGLSRAAALAGLPHRLQRVGSMMTLFFGDIEIFGWQEAQTCDRGLFARYFWGMINEGVYMPCSQFEALFFSQTHTAEQIDHTIAAAEKVLQAIAEKGHSSRERSLTAGLLCGCREWAEVDIGWSVPDLEVCASFS